MKGILKSVKLIERKTKDGKKFKIVEYSCDCKVNDKGEVKTLKGSMSEDYARKYFAFCDTTTKESIGKEVECVVAKRAYIGNDEKEHIVNYIKFLNLLDKDGKAIIMKKDEDNSSLDF